MKNILNNKLIKIINYILITIITLCSPMNIALVMLYTLIGETIGYKISKLFV